MVLATLLAASQVGQEISYPAMGSAVRKQILDAVRPYTYVKDLSKIKFIVPYMAVKGNLALVQCSTEDPESLQQGPFATMGELTACFLVRKNSKWKPVGFIQDPHEGIGPGQAYVIDLRSVAKLGFTKEMYPAKSEGMDKNLTILSDVRRLGFTYTWIYVGEEHKIISVPGSEIDSAKKIDRFHRLFRGSKAMIIKPEL